MVPVIAKGDPAGQKSFKLLAFLHVGIGGHGSFLHFISIGSHSWPFGHLTSLHGSKHLHIGQPVVALREKPDEQNIRHDAAGHSTIFGVEQLTLSSLSARVPGISIPYSSTQKQCVLSSSLLHWICSKSPSRLHLGILTWTFEPRSL
jgi:hypothetical protein